MKTKKASQAIMEYFLIMVVVVAITVIGASLLMPKIKTAADNYADNRISLIATGSKDGNISQR